MRNTGSGVEHLNSAAINTNGREPVTPAGTRSMDDERRALGLRGSLGGREGVVEQLADVRRIEP